MLVEVIDKIIKCVIVECRCVRNSCRLNLVIEMLICIVNDCE